ncbi:MAG TPA: hypothetical protein VM598_06255, partial [Bdellovibrionota bacterium]|nr:hypothetical protein [Bdellovibrionota bacterium]
AAAFKIAHPGKPASAVVSFSTHGWAYRGKHYLMLSNSRVSSFEDPGAAACIDATPDGEVAESCGFLSSDELLSLLASSGVDQVLFFTTSCHSGQIVQILKARAWAGPALAIFVPVGAAAGNVNSFVEQALERSFKDFSLAADPRSQSFSEFRDTFRFHMDQQAQSAFYVSAYYETPGFDGRQVFRTLSRRESRLRLEPAKVRERWSEPSRGILSDRGRLLWSRPVAAGATYEEAVRACEDFDAGGWRLPTAEEYDSALGIRDSRERFHDGTLRSVDHVFPAFGPSDAYFWIHHDGSTVKPYAINIRTHAVSMIHEMAWGLESFDRASARCVRSP